MDIVAYVTFPENTSEPPPDNEPSVGLYRMKRDQEMYVWDFKVRDVAPDPAVNRTGEISDQRNFRRATFSKAWQFFWADLLAMRVYGRRLAFLEEPQAGEIRDVFSNLTRSDKFLNNRDGTNNRNNYVTGDDDRGQDPKIDPLVCADSIVEVLELRTSTSGATAGLVMARLKTFMESDTPPIVTQDLLDNDPRVLRATEIYPEGYTHNFAQIENRFPWLDDYWVPYPYIAKDECWFPVRDLEKVG